MGGSDSSGEPPSSTSSDSASTSTTSTSEPATSTGPGSSCGDGVVDDGEACDPGAGAAADCDDDCTVAECGDQVVNEAAGEACDDGNEDSEDACVDCVAAVCGDGWVQAGVEECDDSNDQAGDGCDGCLFERWSHYGVATDVPLADLHLWEPCWEDTYTAGKLVADLPASCTGDHLLVACKPVDADTLTVAAHAPRDAVLKEVDYDNGERSSANGVSFFWAPYTNVIGLGPEGFAYCEEAGLQAPKTLCWWAAAGQPQKFTDGYRCGTTASSSPNVGAGFQRLVFQAWD